MWPIQLALFLLFVGYSSALWLFPTHIFLTRRDTRA
jgi:hypothetical protein